MSVKDSKWDSIPAFIIFGLYLIFMAFVAISGNTFLGQSIHDASTGWHIASILPIGAFLGTFGYAAKEKTISGLQMGLLFVSAILIPLFLAGFTFNHA
jgi:hypothetical protein